MFFCYHRDRPGSASLRWELREEHWSYMDRFADRMVARGPTMDGEMPRGSLHILDLPDPAAARAFAFDEPGYQAGVYRDVLLRRWRQDAGDSMWTYPGDIGENGYLVLGLGPASGAERQTIERDGLIMSGALLSDDGRARLGTAALLVVESGDDAATLLGGNRYAAKEVHQWQLGGRPA